MDPVAPGPDPLRRRKVVTVSVIVAVLVLLLGAGAVFALSRTSAPGAGDCVVTSGGPSTAMAVRKIDCGAPEATYRVSAAPCPEGDYLAAGDLCLALDVVAGDCLRPVDHQDASAFHTWPCDQADVRRVTRVQDAADRGACGAGPAHVYAAPPRTVCLDR
ncbi:hypothetical protein AB0I60_36725 [Actinosynnema sp. NPDC050436]|uniref:LppU/SCO3897 family protein n=1 Tax=Actinosynnema sp. NPDC050436 TaxID=3155659 RepID=UPI003406CD03